MVVKKREGQNWGTLWLLWATGKEGEATLASSSPHSTLCPRSCVGFKLMAMLAVGNKVPVGPEAVLQTVSLFAFGDFSLLLLFLFFFILILVLIFTPHILDVLEEGKNEL